MDCIKCGGGFVGRDPLTCGPCLRDDSFELAGRAKDEGEAFMADVRAEDAEYFQD